MMQGPECFAITVNTTVKMESPLENRISPKFQCNFGLTTSLNLHKYHKKKQFQTENE